MDIVLIENVINDQRESFLARDKGIDREVDCGKYVKTKQITIISGIRRCGKSVLLSQFSRHFKDFHYVNFDDERLINFTIEDFNDLLVVFKKRSDSKVLFIDEIQNVKNWERFARRIYDDGYKIYITGSNAKLLSSELATHLTGRYIKIELYPFSFREYLSFKKINPSKKTTTLKSRLLKAFDEYLLGGGFPDYVKYKDNEFLKRIYENVLFKDLIARFGIREIKVFRELANYLFSNFTKEISYNSLKSILNIKNVTSIKNYVGYMEESYLLFELFKYDYSLKKQYVSEKKIYAIDNGIRNEISFYFSDDKGKMLENLIFLELKRRFSDIYFFKGKNECDFIVKEKNKITKVIQSSFVLNEGNRNREIKGAVEAIKKFKLKKGYIITYNQNEKIIIDGAKIEIIPIIDWLTK